MKVVVRESTMVRPAEKSPTRKLWNSSLDLIAKNGHTQTVFFYRPNGAPNLLDTKVLKDALSRALVVFYPLAGRFQHDQDGRVEINCQGQGGLFLEAESDSVIDDFGDFEPTLEYLKLIPVIDYSLGIESFPLLLLQITSFKCGGVSLGVATHHHVVDGTSAVHFLNTWCEMARGVDITLPPFLDRTLLRPRDPPRPVFEHIEYYNSNPTLDEEAKSSSSSSFSMFKLIRNQLDLLKAKTKEDGNTINNYSSYETLSAHVWKCVCKARGLPYDVETKLYIPVDGRARLEPPLPPGYFGNVTFTAVVVAKAGDVQSKPTWYAASKIHDAIVRMNNDYLRSAIDYLEQHNCPQPKPCYKYTDLRINSWTRMGIQSVDFGWGRPIFMGRNGIPTDGKCYVLPSLTNDGSLSVLIGLKAEQMKLFGNLLYAL